MYMNHTAADYLRHIGLPADYQVDGILAYGTWDLNTETTHIPYLMAALDARGIAYSVERITHPMIGHAYELLTGGKRYWFVPVMGTAIMANYLHLGSLFGSARNILLGIVGGLAPGMKSGDLIIPTGITGNDNALMYSLGSVSLHEPDAIMLGRLRTALTDSETRVWEGYTNTCEMMLAETQEDVTAWSEAGVLGVEMEGALTFALSKHFGIPSAALFYVADNLVEQETLLSDGHHLSRSARDDARAIQYDLGLQLLLDSELEGS